MEARNGWSYQPWTARKRTDSVDPLEAPFLAKPFNPWDLVRMLETLLQTRE